MSKTILVTGANGQLGQTIKKKAKNVENMRFVFANSNFLDVTDSDNCKKIFDQINPDFCINTSAYTGVEKAETDSENAYNVNTIGCKNVALCCHKYNTTLLHISTDFVFDGQKNIPYAETDKPNPKNVYGTTKLKGEQEIQTVLEKYFIVRTSWLYSEFGANFYKTMLLLASESKSINVVNDQIGTPTNANSLAEILLKIIEHQRLNTEKLYGIYHFSNGGSCSWYDFAKKIFKLNSIYIKLNPVSTSDFPTLAQRPKYSVLDTTKIQKTFGIEIGNWEEILNLSIRNGLK